MVFSLCSLEFPPLLISTHKGCVNLRINSQMSVTASITVVKFILVCIFAEIMFSTQNLIYLKT